MVKKKPKATSEREVKHAKPRVVLYDADKPLTADTARKLMGWEEEKEGGKIKFGNSFLLKTASGAKVRCLHNTANRPLRMSNVSKLKQEILRRRWYLNMENRIIGRTGLVLNGQHTFIALILAVQEWTATPEAFPHWDKEPTIET